MRFAVMLLFIMLTGTTRRLRVDNGLNKNEGSSVHDPSDEVSEAKAPEATRGCKNGLAAPDAPTGASDLSINEANGFAIEAIL
jgi:hypothetical protein